jgi:hypothetical protein
MMPSKVARGIRQVPHASTTTPTSEIYEQCNTVRICHKENLPDLGKLCR